MAKKIKYFIVVSALSIAVSSCSFLDMDPNTIVRNSFYNSEAEVIHGLAGVYGALGRESVYGNYYSLMLSNIDDLSYSNRTSTNNFSQLYAHDASSTEIFEAWTSLYAGIGNANAFMEAVENSEFDPEHKYYNEARFMRAYYHFILAQAWGDVPKKEHSATSPEDVMCAATPQHELLKWVASEMEACLPLAEETLENAPSRVVKVTMQGILARVYLFMAGATVEGNEAYRKDYYGKAREYAWEVIKSARGIEGATSLNISLNPSYSQVFINMITDTYDKTWNESLWEVDFLGDRSSSAAWTNGRIGDCIGLQSNASEDFSNWACNYSYAYYNGSLKLFNLYYETDRTDNDVALMASFTAGDDLTDESVAEKYHWDKRQAWNMCPYNYSGNTHVPPYPTPEYVPDTHPDQAQRSYDKTPYVASSVSTAMNATVARGIRNCGKWRRETIYEAQMSAKDLYTCINFPLLRYSDVLLMFAEADNEYNGTPSQEAYNCVKEVRDRAGIETRPFADYSSYTGFQQFVRDERGRELCFESLRKYDLIRWGIFVEEMRGYVTDIQDPDWPVNTNSAPNQAALLIGQNVQERHVLLPIPSIELGVNTSLTQNKLW